MTSWRDSDDPRCPACGEKITATASYCMHCDAEFTEDGSVVSGTGDGGSGGTSTTGTGSDNWGTVDGSADPTGSDDVVPDGTDEGPDADGSDGLLDFGGSDAESDVGQTTTADVGSDDQSDVGQSTVDEVGQSTTADVGQSTTGEAGSDAGSAVGQDGADAVEETTLLLRGPVCVIMGLPAGIMTAIATLMAFGDSAGSLVLLAFLGGWVGVGGYLLRKPLASDAIGDGFYVYAVLLLILPVVLAIGMAARSLIGYSEEGVGEALFAGIALEIFFVFPAGFFLLLGYGANYYAKQKMEAALDRRGKTA